MASTEGYNDLDITEESDWRSNLELKYIHNNLFPSHKGLCKLIEVLEEEEEKPNQTKSLTMAKFNVSTSFKLIKLHRKQPTSGLQRVVEIQEDGTKMWEMKCGIDEMLGSLVSLLKDMKVHTADNDSITEEIFVAQMNAENLKRSSQETSQLLPQSPDDIQLNDCGDSVRSTSHVGYDMVHYQNWEQMATSTTEESQTNTASGDEVHVEQIRVFGLTPSSAVDKNKLVSGRVQVFHASSAPVGQGHIQGRTNTNPSVVSGRPFPCHTLTSSGRVKYKWTHLSDVAETIEDLTVCNGKEGASHAPLNQTEDLQAVPLQCGHVLYSKLQGPRQDTFFPLPPIIGAKELCKGTRDGEYIPPPPTPRDEGCRVLLSNVPEFSERERVPCPSRVVRSMQRVRHGRGFPIYHKNKAFIAEETATPLDQLEVWSGLRHRNVLELSAVLGDCDGHPETIYQLTPVFTGDLKHLMGKCHLPSLRECLSLLFSDQVDLILWNVKYILREILEGLEYLHSFERIVHGNLKLQNILVDVRCNCEDIFQCSHEGDSGYRVYISDFDQAVHIGEGGATEWDDMSSFGLLLIEIFGITKVDECTAVERECVGLEGLYDVVSACHELNLEEIPTAAELLQHSFFSLHPPGGVCDSIPPPLSPPNSCSVEYSSPPLAVQAQQEPHEEGCKQVLGYKTPEELAHLLTSKDSQSFFQTDLSQSDVVNVIQSTDSSPILNRSSSVSSVDSGGKDSDRVRPTQHDSRTMNTYPNNTSEEWEALMAELQAKRKVEIVTQSRSGAVVFSRCVDFPCGSSAPLLSKEAMSAFIGKGGNGVVSYVYHNGKEFAVKETCLREDELLTLSKLSHHNVMEISAVIEGERHERYHGGRACYQLMPRVTGDVKKMMDDREMPTLCHYFFKFKTESEKASYVLGNAKFILREALSGLQYLHKIGVVHRDVKLQNILVDVRCNYIDIFQCPHEGDSGYRVYISDFDSVLDVERTRKRLEKRSEMRLPLRYGVHGTPGYRPPEACYYCSSNEVIPSYLSTSQDIWSFGCTLMKFFVGSSGPSTQKELSSVKLSHCLQQQPGFVVGIQPSLRHSLTVGDKEMKKLLKVSLLEKYFPLATKLHDIIQGCLKVDPTQRPTVEEILKHSFFKSNQLQNGDSPSRQDEPDPLKDHSPQRQKNESDSSEKLPLVLGKPTACASDENPENPKPSLVTGHLRPLNATENRMLPRISQVSSHSQCSAVESNSGQGRTSSASCCKVAGPDGSVRDYHPKKKVDHERNYTKHRLRHLKAAQDQHERRMEH